MIKTSQKKKKVKCLFTGLVSLNVALENGLVSIFPTNGLFSYL